MRPGIEKLQTKDCRLALQGLATSGNTRKFIGTDTCLAMQDSVGRVWVAVWNWNDLFLPS